MVFGAILATIGSFLFGLSVRNSYSNNLYFGWTYTYQNHSACFASNVLYLQNFDAIFDAILPFKSETFVLSLSLTSSAKYTHFGIISLLSKLEKLADVDIR